MKPPSTVAAIDISAAQGVQIDFEKVAATGISIVVIECEIGNDGPAPDRIAQIKGALAAGLRVLPYVFAYPLPSDGIHPGRDPVAQVTGWLADLNALGVDLTQPIVVDAEWPKQQDWAKWGDNADFVRGWLQIALEDLERATGVTPWLFGPPAFLEAIGCPDDASFVRYPLFISNWDVLSPTVPGPWTDWQAWQWTNTGHVDGIETPVDLSWIKVPANQADTDPEIVDQPETD